MERLLNVVNLIVLISSERAMDYHGLKYFGCMKPFLNSSMIKIGASTWITSIGFAACADCRLKEEMVMLRGVQCYCIKFDDWKWLMTVNSELCNIKCEDNHAFTCGGNLGGSVYYDQKHKITDSGIEHFDYRRLTNEEFLLGCSYISCGVPGDARDHMYRKEYLPQLKPEDCIIYCSLREAAYAMLGWDGTNIEPIHG